MQDVLYMYLGICVGINVRSDGEAELAGQASMNIRLQHSP